MQKIKPLVFVEEETLQRKYIHNDWHLNLTSELCKQMFWISSQGGKIAFGNMFNQINNQMYYQEFTVIKRIQNFIKL